VNWEEFVTGTASHAMREGGWPVGHTTVGSWAGLEGSSWPALLPGR
jgi:hypothetical protein